MKKIILVLIAVATLISGSIFASESGVKTDPVNLKEKNNSQFSYFQKKKLTSECIIQLKKSGALKRILKDDDEIRLIKLKNGEVIYTYLNSILIPGENNLLDAVDYKNPKGTKIYLNSAIGENEGYKIAIPANVDMKCLCQDDNNYLFLLEGYPKEPIYSPNGSLILPIEDIEGNNIIGNVLISSTRNY